MRETAVRYARVARADVAAVEAILEGYEGLVSTATVDPARSVLRILVPAAFAEDAAALLEALSREYAVEILSDAEAARYAETVTHPRPAARRTGETPPGSPSGR